MTTIAERAYLSRVAALGCFVCRHLGYGNTPAEVHHQRTGTGAGMRAKNDRVAPLCPEHHRGRSGLHGMGRKAFERHYGFTEIWMIEKTKEQANG